MVVYRNKFYHLNCVQKHLISPLTYLSISDPNVHRVFCEFQKKIVCKDTISGLNITIFHSRVDFNGSTYVNNKVILLRGEATETGRRTKFRELRRLRRWNENVNRQPKAKLDGRKRHLLQFPMASPINYPLSQ